MTKVKICGITNLEDALLSIKFGADELGFNFYGKSPRYISPKVARQIVDELPQKVLKIGVFVNKSLDGILETAKVAGLDAIQLHGDEENRFIEEVHMMSGLPIIKALKISTEFDPKTARVGSAEAILLDSYSTTEYGGTGETFDWNLAKKASIWYPKLYLAGGLTSENVAEAIKTVKPYAVDACSRLESAPGKKDPEKLAKFIAAVRETI